MKGTLLAIAIFLATGVLLAIGYIWPIPTAVYFAGGKNMLRPDVTPEAAVENLGYRIREQEWRLAYESLANKAQFSQTEFIQDLTGRYLSLRSLAKLSSVEVRPLHESADEAEMEMIMQWSAVTGVFDTTRDLHLVKNGKRWMVDWPLHREPHVPPQVITMNPLEWNVIEPSSDEGWGAQSVTPPNVRVVDMRPISRASGVVILGELLNQDVVPAWVSVRATLLTKAGSKIASAGSFDMISHKLLPKQVTPFLIRFPGVSLSQVGSIQLSPISVLVSTSSAPVIEVQDQQFHPGPDAALTGEISNQSGEVVHFAHVLSTFYDKNGQLVWIAGKYVSRALLPESPVSFSIPVPEDIAGEISSERTVVATYTGENSL